MTPAGLLGSSKRPSTPHVWAVFGLHEIYCHTQPDQPGNGFDTLRKWLTPAGLGAIFTPVHLKIMQKQPFTSVHETSL